MISKDVAHGPILGDEIEFHLSHNGEVTMMRNRGAATLVMHVDVSLPLWAIFDVYGSTRAIRLLGTIAPPQPPATQPEQPVIYQSVPARVSPPRAQQPLPPVPVQQQQPVYQTLVPAHQTGTTSSYVETLTHTFSCQSSPGGIGSSSECTVCYERSVDCVLYSCGHMCLCYDCALTLYRGGRTAGGQGLCPICRAPIRDVIRAYRS